MVEELKIDIAWWMWQILIEAQIEDIIGHAFRVHNCRVFIFVYPCLS
jgi:hypothetical protein